MSTRQLARLLAVSAATACALLSTPINIPSASAQPCLDVDVVFARGTNEPPGAGPTGEAFVTALRPLLGTKSVGVYAVNYPATIDFATGVDGIRDATAHIRDMAATCPQTKMVLGGFSQGAAVMGFVTANTVPDGIPDGIDPADIPRPMPPEVAKHVAAVVLIGKPSNQFMKSIGQPPITIGQLYAPKVKEFCAPGDVICSDEGDFNAHGLYTVNGMPNDAASFAASRVGSGSV
jgi:cutinase